MRIAVIGAGGVGGFYGAKLAEAGHDVTFLARGAHLDAIRHGGLVIEDTVTGAQQRHDVRAVDDIAVFGEVDLVLLAVKLWDTEAAVRQVTPIVGADTAILSLQNGVIKDDILRGHFGAHRVMGGVAYIASAIARPGVIGQTGTMQKITVGEYDGHVSERARVVVDSFAAAGVDATLSDRIEGVLWEKFVFLVGLSAMTTATRLPIGAVRSDPASRRLLEQVIAEAVAVGRARGVDLPADFVADRMAFVDTLPPTMKASMLHDFEAGKPLELQWLSGGVVDMARDTGVQVSANAAIVGVLSPHAEGARNA